MARSVDVGHVVVQLHDQWDQFAEFAPLPRDLEELACAVDYGDEAMNIGSGPFGAASGRPVPVAVETFHALKQRQTTEVIIPVEALRVNLLNWDGLGGKDE